MPITVVCWNLNHWQGTIERRRAAWDYLANPLNADVALVQEAGAPPDGWHSVGSDIGEARAWGTRVVSHKHELTEVRDVREVGAEPQPYWPSRAGTAATATVQIEGRSLTLVSLYGLMEPKNSYATVNRHLADLAPLLDAPAHISHTIVGGDLNLTSQWAGVDAAYAPIDRAILTQFGAWGLRNLVAGSTHERLTNCPCDEGNACRHRQTFWKAGDDVPRQNDYLFASKRLSVAIDLTIDTHAVEAGLSDHAPLVATLGPEPPVERGWL